MPADVVSVVTSEPTMIPEQPPTSEPEPGVEPEEEAHSPTAALPSTAPEVHRDVDVGGVDDNDDNPLRDPSHEHPTPPPEGASANEPDERRPSKRQRRSYDRHPRGCIQVFPAEESSSILRNMRSKAYQSILQNIACFCRSKSSSNGV